jgi:hypothetical protein
MYRINSNKKVNINKDVNHYYNTTIKRAIEIYRRQTFIGLDHRLFNIILDYFKEIKRFSKRLSTGITGLQIWY